MAAFYDTTEKTMTDNNQQKKLSLQLNNSTPFFFENTSPLIRPALNNKCLTLMAAIAACVASPQVKMAAAAEAQTAATIRFDIPAQDLAQALSAFTLQSRLHILYEGAIAQGLRSAPLKGSYRPQEALRILLSGTSLRADFVDERTVTLARKAASATDVGGANAATLPAMHVTAGTVFDPNDPYNTEYTIQNSSTATKTDTPLIETPVSVQVVPRAVMSDQKTTTIKEALENVSSVRPQSSLGLSNAFIIRGFRNGRIFRNGLVANGLGIGEGAQFESANLERVEVLKGPAAVLFGRIEPGG